MEDRTIEYRFRLPDGSRRTFGVKLSEATGEMLVDVLPEPPDWTALEHEMCPHCPLSPEEHPRCPAALSIAGLVTAFDGLFSYEKVELEVVMPDRTVRFEELPLQKALGSLIGLVLPASGCPHTAFLRPMARFHVPVASVDETVYRAASMHLLGQWLRRRRGLDTDEGLEGLTRSYRAVNIVNKHLHARLRGETNSDSSRNAVVVLDVLAQFLPMAVEESLKDIQPLFDSYLNPDPPERDP